MNNLGFDLFAVQPDSSEWIKLNSEMIIAQGLGLEPQDYTFETVRPDLAAGTVFYLRAYDLNGTFEDFGPIQAALVEAEPPVVSPGVPGEDLPAPPPEVVAPPRRNTGGRFQR